MFRILEILRQMRPAKRFAKQLWLIIQNQLQQPEVQNPAKRRNRNGTHRLPVIVFQQRTRFSCTASCVQSLWKYYAGETIGHRKAIDLVKCRPDGAELIKIARVMKKHHKCRIQRLHRPSMIRSAIKKGAPVIAADNLTYSDGHAILITGYTPTGFWTSDSAVGAHIWRHEKRLLRASDEFIAVHAG